MLDIHHLGVSSSNLFVPPVCIRQGSAANELVPEQKGHAPRGSLQPH